MNCFVAESVNSRQLDQRLVGEICQITKGKSNLDTRVVRFDPNWPFLTQIWQKKL